MVTLCRKVNSKSCREQKNGSGGLAKRPSKGKGREPPRRIRRSTRIKSLSRVCLHDALAFRYRAISNFDGPHLHTIRGEAGDAVDSASNGVDALGVCIGDVN
jgi:hypothetical protein